MKLIFMGTPDSAVPTLRRCVEGGHEVLGVWTQPDRPAGRGNRLKAPPVKEYALSAGLAVHQPAKIRTEEALALFNAREFDVAVVVAYGRILPPAFLRAPRKGCVNVREIEDDEFAAEHRARADDLTERAREIAARVEAMLNESLN